MSFLRSSAIVAGGIVGVFSIAVCATMLAVWVLGEGNYLEDPRDHRSQVGPTWLDNNQGNLGHGGQWAVGPLSSWPARRRAGGR